VEFDGELPGDGRDGRGGMSAPLVLVVEDNQPLRRMVGLTLSTAGYRVAEASDGREALEQARRELPALVLTDLMLPDLDGAQLLVKLRALPSADRLPVIAVSGSRGKLDALTDEPAQFNEFLLKPVPTWQLVATAGRYAALQSPDATIGVGRALLLVDDNSVQLKLQRLQLERLGFIVSTASDGAAALRAARAMRPDVIVSDVLMPEVDGFELCRAVRADPELRTVPVVLMSSAYLADADRRLADRAGATAYLERGPDLAELELTLSACIHAEPDAELKPFPEFDLEHARRVRRQLDAYVTSNAKLSEHLELKTVELSVVAGIANLITRALDAPDVLDEALTRCLEVAGVAAGTAWLCDEQGTLRCATDAGAADHVAALRTAVERLVADNDLALSGGLVMLHPDELGCGGVAASLAAGGETLGVLAISWHDPELDTERVGFVRTIAGQLSEAIAVRRAIRQLDSSREETIRRLALAAEFRDNDTARHTERVSLYSSLLARRLGLGDARAELIRVASVMHDVGKIGVSDAILLKPDSLTPEEFEQIKLHTTVGHRILGASKVELLELAATIALTHHERVDGTGYPQRLIADEIPIEGRIVAVADVFDALTSRRVYRPAMTVENAIATMRAGRGTQFDAQVLDTFLESLDEILSIRARSAAAIA
jgi:response regulator RpfG family c-di-GMP phosphodiesterase